MTGEFYDVDPEKLRNLLEAVDDIGVQCESVVGAEGHLEEVSFKVGNVWMTFFANRSTLAELERDAFWARDAMAVAEGMWRE